MGHYCLAALEILHHQLWTLSKALSSLSRAASTYPINTQKLPWIQLYIYTLLKVDLQDTKTLQELPDASRTFRKLLAIDSLFTLQALAEKVFNKQMQNSHALADERKKKNYVEFWNIIPVKDPYRLVLSELRDRLYHTREILHHALVHPSWAPRLSSPCHPTLDRVSSLH